MSFFALTLVLLAAVLHASWNIAVKAGGGGPNFSIHSAGLVAIVWAPVVGALIQLSPDHSPLNWTVEMWGVVALSAVFHSCYVSALLCGYRHAPLSIVYPTARGTGPLLSASCAILIFGEMFSLYTAVGITGIVVGVVLLSWKERGPAEGDSAIFTGVLWGVITGGCIATYTVLDGYAVKSLGVNPICLDYVTNLIRVPLLFPFAHRKALFSFSAGHLKAMLVVSVFGPLAYILVLYAMQIAPLSHVAPAREVSLLMGVFLSGRFLNETHRVRRLFAAGVIAVGVMALTAAPE